MRWCSFRPRLANRRTLIKDSAHRLGLDFVSKEWAQFFIGPLINSEKRSGVRCSAPHPPFNSLKRRFRLADAAPRRFVVSRPNWRHRVKQLHVMTQRGGSRDAGARVVVIRDRCAAIVHFDWLRLIKLFA